MISSHHIPSPWVSLWSNPNRVVQGTTDVPWPDAVPRDQPNHGKIRGKYRKIMESTGKTYEVDGTSPWPQWKYWEILGKSWEILEHQVYGVCCNWEILGKSCPAKRWIIKPCWLIAGGSWCFFPSYPQSWNVGPKNEMTWTHTHTHPVWNHASLSRDINIGSKDSHVPRV